MSPRAWPFRVRDILDAVVEIRSFAAGMTQAQFASDARTRKAVLADFIIIGEAASPSIARRRAP